MSVRKYRFDIYTRLTIYIITVLLLFFAIPAASLALPSAIWESSEESVITRGVTLERVNRFTVEGWLAINILRVDLTDPYVSLDALYNPAALQDLTTVEALAERQGAVAAINAGYFEWNDDWGGTAIGTVMQQGRVDSAFSETNAFGEVMASFTINRMKEVLFAYCVPKITMSAGKSTQLNVGSYNKRSFYEYRDIAIHDRKWVRDSVGASKSMPDIVELVVERGVVREVRVGMPSIVIPIDGFVATTRLREDGTHAFSGEDFAIGSPVDFNVALSPSMKDPVTHVEGASMLLLGGVIPQEFSYDPGYIASRNPRTMVGCNRDRDMLLLVTVDGRQLSSIGLSSYESAELMRSLGCYDALSLDGGGSTTMVTRIPGANYLELVNSVSDGSMRPVVNGFGVFTNAPKAAVRGIYIDTIDKSVFVGAHRQFTVRAYDRYYNPVEVSGGNIVWSVSGVAGKIDNGLLVTGGAGEGVVRAKMGRATASVRIKSPSTPSELILNATSLSLKPGEKHAFAVIGRDNAGFSARINPADVTWSASDSFGSIDNGVFTRGADKYGYIAATYGNAIAYCAVQPLPIKKTEGKPDGKSGGDAQAPPIKLPPASRIADRANRSVDTAVQEAGAALTPAPTYRFGVLGEISAPQPETADGSPNAGGGSVGAPASADSISAVNESFRNLVDKTLDCGIFVGYGKGNNAAAIQNASAKPLYYTNKYFEVHNSFCGDPDRTLIRLSTLGDGLRAAGSGQWKLFFNALRDFSGKDLFIILQQGPSTFGDKYEAALFKRTLAECVRDGGYNIWVFYSGPADIAWLEDGVRYFTCAGAASPAADVATGAGAKYLEVTVWNDKVYYEFKPLL